MTLNDRPKISVLMPILKEAEPLLITETLVSDLIAAQFLIALQHIDTTGAPLAGEHSFYRGSALKIYDVEAR